MASPSTVGFIVNRAVELAQLDSSFLQLARQHYNLIIDDIAISFNWPFYRVQYPDVPFVAGKLSYDLPTDWVRSDTCYLIDQNNNRKELPIISKYRFDRLLRGGVGTGDPRVCYTDLTNRKLIFDFAPSSIRAFQFTYFRHPETCDESGGDDAAESDCESPMYMINKICANLLDYNDDERAPGFHQKAEQILSKNKLFAWDEDNQSIVELGVNYRPGRRPTRNSGGGFFNP
jgi:hypothetical protein